MKKEENNDIYQLLLPKLENLGYDRKNIKIDVTTKNSKNLRGDIWISKVSYLDKAFENNIYSLIEAKHRNCILGDVEWRDAMRQGKEKATKQKLTYYIVTNCNNITRFYNVFNNNEIELDGKILVNFVTSDVLNKIQTQISENNSYVINKVSIKTKPFEESKFLTTLNNLANIYRSAGLKKGDERIDPTVCFVVLKYISEKEEDFRTLDNSIKIWKDLLNIANGNENGDLRSEFNKIIEQIWGKDSEYKENIYIDFKDLITFPNKLKNEHFKKIYIELNNYHFHGANFDLFGLIYEEFASQTKKKEFGEFYTRRHITKIVTELILSNEINPRELKICDVASGSGGFLTEAYQTLIRNYSINAKLNKNTEKILQTKVFYGYDNDAKSVARTKLNMFLVGDGHINIHENDSLQGWKKEIGFDENNFDYIITNPPMGKYDGNAQIENFSFTNERRYELLFTEKVIRMTKHGGEIAIVLNDGALEAPTRMNFRKNLLLNCNILAIVSLTKFAFAPYTKEKTYILFMQKKQKEEIGEIQKNPIWNFIVDYDGYANSDKRFKTKYHDDLTELKIKFIQAVNLIKNYLSNSNNFNNNRKEFEREANEKEIEEGINGKKYGYVEISQINENNFYNLLCEYYLRPYISKEITETEFEKQCMEIINEIKKEC